jgi:uncharacterized repeat protein (TIGR04138 family)
MSMRHSALAEIVRRDPRYVYEAYEFVFAALQHTQKMLDHPPRREGLDDIPQNHVSGRQLVEGIRDLALREFGLMARTVFRCWGITKTGDFGEIVFNLIEAGLMSKTPEDSREDFQDVLDLDAALTRNYVIRTEEGN